MGADSSADGDGFASSHIRGVAPWPDFLFDSETTASQHSANGADLDLRWLIMSRVFLHIGLPKTGTTHLQEVLWHNKSAATAQGLLYPGYVVSSHFHAAVDLQRAHYDTWVTPLADGAWDRIVEYVRRWSGDAVISSELLVTATHEEIDRALTSLSFAEVHIVCTARDLARQVPSVWQENIRNRHTESFPEFLSSVRRPAPSPIGDLFWSYQNLTGVLANWSRDIPGSP
jgi:hypothetical protein